MNNSLNDKEYKADSQLDQRLLELTALFEISRSLTSSLSINSILDNILRIPMGQMLISKGVVLIKKKPKGDFILEASKGVGRTLQGKTLNIIDPPNQLVMINEMGEQHEWVEFFKEFGIKILIPLISSQGIIGIVGFGDKIGQQPYLEREVEFLNSLSNIAASAVANGLMVEEIRSINRDLDRNIQQLNTIFDISRELNMTLDREKIGSLLSFAVMGELMVNKCVVFVKREERMEVLVSKGITSEISHSSELCEISEFLNLNETERFQQYREMGINVLVPMRIQDETKGVLALGSKISGGGFSDADREFLTTLGNQAMSSLENARLFEEALEKQRMEEELNLARNIQQGLLPSKLPDLEGHDIAATNIPSRQVGGDYFDVIKIEEDRYGIAIADVSGKGAGAALLMSNLQASLHVLISTGVGVGEMVAKINNLIFENTDLDKFITFFYGELNTKENKFTYCNAGHNPPFKINRNGKIEELMTGGLILGMMPDQIFETETISLDSGDSIVMFTDGITEAMNEKSEEFGEERLKSIIKKSLDLSSKELMEKIIGDVRKYSGSMPQADDITIIILRVR